MTLIKVKGREFDDYKKNQLADRFVRQRQDVLSGLSKAKGAQRGDFELCRKLDKTLKDYRDFKNPNDRKKITDEYYGRQQEYRNNRRD